MDRILSMSWPIVFPGFEDECDWCQRIIHRIDLASPILEAMNNFFTSKKPTTIEVEQFK